MKRNALSISLLAALAWLGPVDAQDAPRQYTFSWPIDGENLKPRGGTTKGAPVTVDAAPSAEWRALQEPDLATAERDRRAILAMAGSVESGG